MSRPSLIRIFLLLIIAAVGIGFGIKSVRTRKDAPAPAAGNSGEAPEKPGSPSPGALKLALAVSDAAAADVDFPRVMERADHIDQLLLGAGPGVSETVVSEALKVANDIHFRTVLCSEQFWLLVIGGKQLQPVTEAIRARKIDSSGYVGYALGTALSRDPPYQEGRDLLKSITADNEDALVSFHSGWAVRDTALTVGNLATLSRPVQDAVIYRNAALIAQHNPAAALKLSELIQDEPSRQMLISSAAAAASK